MSRWSLLLFVLASCFAVAGCARADQRSVSSPFEQLSGASSDAPAPDSGVTSAPPPDGAERRPGGAAGAAAPPGAPGNGGNSAQAIPSPLTIPDSSPAGAPISAAKPRLQLQFEELCQHQEPCVNLVVSPAGVDPDHCLFSRTDPPMGTTIDRGDTVILLCDPVAHTGGAIEAQPAGGTGSARDAQAATSA